MQRTIVAAIDAPASRVFAVLEDLGTYGRWLDMVSSVEAAAPHPDDAGPAWTVTLRARVGPLARSKRLRMVRTRRDPPSAIAYERAEVDGRRHSRWVLDVAITGDHPCEVRVDLHYGGRFWTAPLDTVLGSQADDAVPRLQALVADAS